MIKPFSTTSVHPDPQEAEELAVLFAGHSQTVPEHRMGPQVLDYYLVHTVIEGTGTYRCRDRLYVLKAGDSFFIFPGELHVYQSDAKEPWRYRWIAFRGRKAAAWLQSAGISAEHPVVNGGVEEALKSAQEIERSFRDGVWTADWEAGGWLRLAFAAWAMARRPEGPPSRGQTGIAAREADRAARWMEAQLAGPVSIGRLAREMGYHRTYLTKMFRKEMGMAPITYLQKLRMERAKVLLRESLTVEEVASSVGYPDALYFSKSFKKWTGCTPTDYRRRTSAQP